MADLSQTSTPSTAPVGAVVSSPEPISVNLSATGNAKAEDVVNTIRTKQVELVERSNQIKAGLDWDKSDPLDMDFSTYVAKVGAENVNVNAWNQRQADRKAEGQAWRDANPELNTAQEVTKTVSDYADPVARLGVSAVRMYNQTIGNYDIDTGLNTLRDYGISNDDAREYQTYMRDVANRNLVQKYLENPVDLQDTTVAEQAKTVLGQLNDRIANNYKGLQTTVTSKATPANAGVNNMVTTPITGSKLDVIERALGNFDMAKQLRENTATYDSLLNNVDRDRLTARIQYEAAQIDAKDAGSIEKFGDTVGSLVDNFWDNPLGAADLFMDSAAYTATAALPMGSGLLLNTYGSMDRAQALEDYQAKHDGAMPLDEKEFSNWQVANFIGGLGDALGEKVEAGALKPFKSLTKAATRIAPESIMARLAAATATGTARAGVVVGSEGLAGTVNELGQQMAGIGGSFFNAEDYAKLDTKELLTQGMLEAMGSFAPGTVGAGKQLVTDVTTDPRTANERNISDLAKSMKAEAKVAEQAPEAPVSGTQAEMDLTGADVAPTTSKFDELQQSDPNLYLAAEDQRSTLDSHLDTINSELLSKNPDGEKIMASVGSMLKQLATIDRAKNSDNEDEAKLGQALDEYLSSKNSRLRKFAKLFEITTDDEQFIASLATQQAFDKVDSFSEEDLARVQQLGTKVLFAKRFDNDEGIEPVNQVFLSALQTVMEGGMPDSAVAQSVGEYAAIKTMARVSHDVAMSDSDPQFVGATAHINKIVDGLATGDKQQVTQSYARLSNLLNSQIEKRDFLQKAIQIRQNEINNGVAETTQKRFENPKHLSKDGVPLHVEVGAKGLNGAKKLLNQVNKEVTLLGSSVDLAEKLISKKDTRQANIAAQSVLTAANTQNSTVTDEQWQTASNTVQAREPIDVPVEAVDPQSAEQLPLDFNNPNEPEQLPLDFTNEPAQAEAALTQPETEQEIVPVTPTVEEEVATAEPVQTPVNEVTPDTAELAEENAPHWSTRLTDVGTVADTATETEKLYNSNFFKTNLSFRDTSAITHLAKLINTRFANAAAYLSESTGLVATAADAAYMEQLVRLYPEVQKAIQDRLNQLHALNAKDYDMRKWRTAMNLLTDADGQILPEVVIGLTVASVDTLFEMNQKEQADPALAVARMLNISDKDLVSAEQIAMLSGIGSMRAMLVPAMGNNIFNALGIKATDTTFANVPPMLKTALAMDMLEVLADVGLLDETTRTEAEMYPDEVERLQAEGTDNSNKRLKAMYSTRIPFYKITTQAKTIGTVDTGSLLENYREGAGVVSTLINPEYVSKFSFAPVTQLATTVLHGAMKLSKVVMRSNKKAQQTPHVLSQFAMHVLSNMPKTQFLELFGYTDPADHIVAKRMGIQGKNQQLEHSYQALVDAEQRVLEQGVVSYDDAPMYFYHANDVNGRQYNRSDLSSQGSKLVRAFVQPLSVIQRGDKKHANAVKLALAQGLGIDADKQSNDKTYADIAQLEQTDTLFNATIRMLQDVENGGNLDTALLSEIMQRYQKSPEHAFHVLTEYARYQNFLEGTEPTFKTTMYYEIDGVTNGPFHSLMLLALNDTPILRKKLKNAGFMTGEEANKNYHHFREGNGEADNYNAMSKLATDKIPEVMQNLASMVSDTVMANMKDTYQGITALMGYAKYIQNGVFARPAEKNRPTTKTYGSGTASSNNKDVGIMLDAVYTKADELYQQAKTSDVSAEITEFLNVVRAATTGHKPYTEYSKEQMRQVVRAGGFHKSSVGHTVNLENFKLTQQDIDTLQANFDVMHGVALDEAANEYLGDLLPMKDLIVSTSNLLHKIHAATVNQYRKQYQKALVAKQRLPERMSLLPEQELALTNALEPMQPKYAIAVSDVNDRDTYAVTTDDSLAYGSTRDSSSAEASAGYTLSGQQIYLNRDAGEAGVKLMPNSIISVDAIMQHLINVMLPKSSLVDVHDAALGRLHELDNLAKAMNEAEITTLNKYNIIRSLQQAVMDVITRNTALNQRELMVGDIALTVDMQEVLKEINLFDPKKGYALRKTLGLEKAKSVSAAQLMSGMRSLVQQVAATADMITAARQSLLQAGWMHQYTGVDGTAVEFANGQAVTKQDGILHLPATPSPAAPQASYNMRVVLDATLSKLRNSSTRKGTVLSAVLEKHQDFLNTLSMQVVDGFADPTTVGTYSNGVITLSKEALASTDTIVHEMIHAIISHFVNKNLVQFFANKNAASAQTLDDEFVTIQRIVKAMGKNIAAVPDQLKNYVLTANNLMNSNPSAENLAAVISEVETAIHEIVAYGATTYAKELAGFGSVKKSGWLTGIFQKLKEAVQRILGTDLAENAYTDLMTSVYAMNSGAYDKSKVFRAERTRPDALSLYNQLTAGVTSEHLTKAMHDIHDSVLAAIKLLPDAVANINSADDQLLLDALTPNVQTSFTQFVSAGFGLNPQEEFVFKLYAETMLKGFELNYVNKVAIHKIFNKVKANYTAEQFIDPSLVQGTVAYNAALVQAQQQYAAVFQPTGDVQPFLANFVALSIVRPNFMTTIEGAAQLSDTEDALVKGQIYGLFNKLARVFRRGSPVFLTNYVQRINHALASTDSRMRTLDKGIQRFGDLADDKVKNFITKTTQAIAGSAPVQRTALKTMGDLFLHASGKYGQTHAEDTKEQLYQILNSPLFRNKAGQQRTIAKIVSEIVHGGKDYKAIAKHKRIKTTAVDASADTIRTQTRDTALGKFKELSEAESIAVTEGFLQTDVSSLLNHNQTHDYILGLFSRDLSTDIATIEQSLVQLGESAELTNFRLNQAEHLGKSMATHETYLGYQLQNAKSIALAAGTGLTVKETAKAEILLDALVSLYAVQHTNPSTKQTIEAMLQRGEAEGLTHVLNTHHGILQQELDGIGESGKYLRHKGSLYDVNDPKKAYKLVRGTELKEYLAMGFTAMPVATDSLDQQGAMYAVTSSEGGLAPWMPGSMTMIERTISSNNVTTGKAVNNASTGIRTRREVAQMSARKHKLVQRYTAGRISIATPITTMVPTIDQQGNVASYTYPISGVVKDKYMGRVKSVEHVLGHWSGRVHEEQTANAYNVALVQSLNEAYQASVSKRKFVAITDQSSSKEIRELAKMLPRSVVQAQKQLTGSSVLYVPADVLDNVVGYRQLSVKDIWESDAMPAQMFKEMSQALLGKRAAYYLSKGLSGLQALVKEVRDIIIVKSVVVPAINLLSNAMQLRIRGVSLHDMRHYLAEGYSAAQEYKAMQKSIARNKAILLGEPSNVTAQHELNQLQAAQQSNPVHLLVQAGLMPSIVEDRGDADNLFSPKADIITLVKDKLDRLPKRVQAVGSELAMTQGSMVYSLLDQAVDLGDFVAKYTLFKHYTNNKGMDINEAMDRVAVEFIDYGMLTNKYIQFAEVTGLMAFFKYYMRIQMVIFDMIKQNPARVLTHTLLRTAGMAPESPLDSIFFNKDLGYKTGLLDILGGITSHPLLRWAK